jgi:hypothetical protein
MEIGATDPAGRDLDDDVAGILDPGIGDGVDADVAGAMPC